MSFPKKYEKEMLHFDRSFLDSFASENDQKVPIIVYCTLKLNACFVFFLSIFSKTDKINNNDINLQLKHVAEFKYLGCIFVGCMPQNKCGVKLKIYE